MNLFARARAKRLNKRGLDAAAEGNTANAIRLYEEASRIDPTWSFPRFNLGLLYKRAGDWEKSLARSLEAADLDGKDQGAIWNAGIAATALGRWDDARKAWRRCGIDIPDGHGPIELDYGLVPIRVSIVNAAEVVWARRIDPARAILQNVPLPETGRRFGDLVLHDGAPNGYRKLGEREVPVFDELMLIRPSAFHTYRVALTARHPEDVEGLEEIFDDSGLCAEDWTRSVRILCKECSEGRPHEGAHVHEDSPAEWNPQRDLGIAASSAEEAQALLSGWASAAPGRGYSFPLEAAL